LRADAAAAELAVDAAIGQVVAVAEWAGTQEWRTELQTQLNAIVAEANTVDRELATAITMADGGTPEAHRAVPQSLPQDLKRFNDLWNTLTSVEKDWLYSQDHYIGNHPGMPWDPTDHRGKDYYNRLHLSELHHQGQADVDRLQHRVDELVRQVYMGDRPAPPSWEERPWNQHHHRRRDSSCKP
jgi:hypothetical protein